MTITIRNADLFHTVTLENVEDVALTYTREIQSYAESVNQSNWELIQRLRGDLEDLRVAWKRELSEAGRDGWQFAGEVDDLLSVVDSFVMHDEPPAFPLEDLID